MRHVAEEAAVARRCIEGRQACRHPQPAGGADAGVRHGHLEVVAARLGLSPQPLVRSRHEAVAPGERRVDGPPGPGPVGVLAEET